MQKWNWLWIERSIENVIEKIKEAVLQTLDRLLMQREV